MNVSPPEEEKEILLPKTCYFNDGKSKVDYVLVFPKIEERVRGDSAMKRINQFITHIKERGLLVERDVGKFYSTLVFLKIHGPHKVLVRYAFIYNIELTCQNPYYKYKENFWFKWLATELTKPDPDSDTYKRAEKTLSGKRPTEITSAERSLIVYEILKRISFMFNDDEVTLKTMLNQEIFLQGYPIHDGDCSWTTEGPLTDRQLLFKFWGNPKYLFKEQPVHLIEKYYGSKISFYFALINFYSRMLVVPTIVGVLTVIVGFILLFRDHFYIQDEVCNSEITLCSDQKLKTACTLMKLAYIIDNPVTIIYVILCSFWGAVFWNIWQRREAMLCLRWNLMKIVADRTMRQEFQENAKTRRSSITGEIEYYIPAYKKVLMSIFSYTVIILMVIIFFLVVFLVVQYRFVLRKSIDYDNANDPNEIELFTSSIITSIIIIIINGFTPFILKTYSKIIRFLTSLRQPRTQTQYNQMYLHMTFILTFANHFTPLFYLAYIKGFLHTYPGNVSKFGFIRRLQTDLCKPAGCLVDLGMQLIAIMVMRTLVKCSFDLVEHISSPWSKSSIPKENEKNYGQWEKDYPLKELDQSIINALYSDMVLQYSFITFFNASLPVIGLVALVHSVLKTQHDAYRFLKLYRRPVIEKVPNIEGWNHILKVVTVMGTISNAFVVAFRTDFILRNFYRYTHDGSLAGYVNSTLSKFEIKEFQEHLIIDHESETYCFYRGFRYPPEHEKRYQPTLQYWEQLAIKCIYFIILENLTLILSLILSYLIPAVPRKVKVKLEYDEKLLRMTKEAQLETEVTKV